jgi:adenylate cyclase
VYPDGDSVRSVNADDLREQLRALGATDTEFDEALAEGRLHILALELSLLDGRKRYTACEVAELIGMDEHDVVAFLRATGLPEPGGDGAVFTESDLQALRISQNLIADGLTTKEIALQFSRVMNSAIARVAEAEVGFVRSLVPLAGDDSDTARSIELTTLILALAQNRLPQLDALLVFSHRRQMLAAAKRDVFVEPSSPGTRAGVLIQAVGFADMVGFTSMSRYLDDLELARAVESFENLVYETVEAEGGRVVKTIGDEVMYVCDMPAPAVEIGLRLVEATADHDSLPPVRAGVAFGSVVGRDGDYFGPVVNLAHRVTEIALPGTVLTDAATHDTLESSDTYRWRPLRPRRLRGIGVVPVWAVRRPGDRPPSPLVRAAHHPRHR